MRDRVVEIMSSYSQRLFIQSLVLRVCEPRSLLDEKARSIVWVL